MTPIMVDVRWKERICLFLTFTMILPLCLTAPQHSSNHGRHFRITISAEDTGEVSGESLQSFSHSSHRSSPGGALKQPMEMTHSWMSFGDSDSSHVGKPVSTHYHMKPESRESLFSKEQDDLEDKLKLQRLGTNKPTTGYSFRLKNDDIDDPFSVEDFSGEYDDNIRIMSKGLGRRYHPVGVPLVEKPLFIPAPANPVTNQNALNHQLNKPQHYMSLESREDINDEIEDIIDDLNESGEYHMPLATMVNKVTGQKRTVLSEDTLGSRYNFIDTQGSVNWGFKLEDQFQKQIVHQDGSMEGEYGWDTPDGSQVHVKYTAGKNGFRVVSSLGVHPDLDDDTLVVNMPNSGFGVPLPGTPSNQANAGNNQQNFGSSNPSFGVPMPAPPNSNSPVGVPLPDFNQNINAGNQNIGVPMPDPSLGGNPNFNQGPLPGGDPFADVGVPLPPSGFPSNQGNQIPNQQSNFGVPMPSLNSNTPHQNVPIDFPVNDPSFQDPSTSFNNPSNIGVPIPDPNANIGQNFAPQPSPDVNFGQNSGNNANFGQDLGPQLSPDVNFGQNSGNNANFGQDLGPQLSPDVNFGQNLGNNANFGQDLGPQQSPDVNFGQDLGNNVNFGQDLGPQPTPDVPNFGVPMPDPNAFPQTGDAVNAQPVDTNFNSNSVGFDNTNQGLTAVPELPDLPDLDAALFNPNLDTSVLVADIDNLFGLGDARFGDAGLGGAGIGDGGLGGPGLSSGGQNLLLSGPPASENPGANPGAPVNGAFPIVR